MTSTITSWKRGPEVRCLRGDLVHASDVMEHGPIACRAHHDGSNCGLCVYVVPLSRNPPLFAWVDITFEQRRHLLDHNLTPLQAQWYLRLPSPLEQSA